MKILAESELGPGDIVRIKKTQEIDVVTGVEVFVSLNDKQNYIQYQVGDCDFYRFEDLEKMTGRPETFTVTDKQ